MAEPSAAASPAADFRRRRFEQHGVVESGGPRDGVGGRTGGGKRGGGFAGKPREVLLHGLEFSDRSLEGDALIGVSDAERQDRLQRAGGLHAAHGRAHQHQRRLHRSRRARARWRSVSRARSVTLFDGVAGEILAVADAAIGGLDQSDRRAFVAGCDDRDVFRIRWRREFRWRVRSSVPSAFNVIRSRGRAGATVMAPAGAAMPARASSHPASSVSASGTGSA